MADFLHRPPLAEGSPSRRFFDAMLAMGKLLIAAVGGPAVGIGTTMLLRCDLVYAAANARFQLPFVPLGEVPEFGSTCLLPLVVGYQRAAELLLLGRPFDAEKAHKAGIATEIVPQEKLLESVIVEFDALLECGILAHGFMRLRWAQCTHEKLVAFSCKRLGFGPSCAARRMVQTAAHLVDQIIPCVPVR